MLAPLQAPSKAGRPPGKDPPFGRSAMAGPSSRDQHPGPGRNSGGEGGLRRPAPSSLRGHSHGHSLSLQLLLLEPPVWVEAGEPGRP